MASELYWVNVVGDAGYWQAGTRPENCDTVVRSDCFIRGG